MKFVILILTGLLFSLSAVSQISPQMEKRCRDAYFTGMSLRKAKDYAQAIDSFRIATRSIGYKAEHLIAICYWELNQIDSFMIYAEKSFMNGRIKPKYYSKFIGETSLQYRTDSTYSKVVQTGKMHTIDSTIRQKLKEMFVTDQYYRSFDPKPVIDSTYKQRMKLMAQVDSINTAMLKAMIEEKGEWIGLAIRGGLADDSVMLPMPDASLIAAHAKEDDQIYFLGKAMESAYNNRSEWRDAQTLMTMLLFRFEKQNGLVKLQYTYADTANKLDIQRSDFQLATLAKLTLDHNLKQGVEIFLVYETEQEKLANESRISILSEIRSVLNSKGIPDSHIKINSEQQKITRGKQEPYYFIGLRHFNIQ